eukprot:m.536221 g.536221  ORF g.536221 m.536221 type:complete len:65 (+) comp22069_c0_seq3:220-414(+)
MINTSSDVFHLIPAMRQADKENYRSARLEIKKQQNKFTSKKKSLLMSSLLQQKYRIRRRTPAYA